MSAKASTDSALALSLDLLSARVLVWVATVGRRAELTSEAHDYFFDRYSRLAAYHRARGRLMKAQRLQAKAELHRWPDEGPPYAAAMAMPRPRQFVRTDAVGRVVRFDGPDEAA